MFSGGMNATSRLTGWWWLWQCANELRCKGYQVGVGLSSLWGMGVVIVTWTGGLPILAHLGGAWSKDRWMGLLVTNTMEQCHGLVNIHCPVNNIDWHVSLSFAACFIVFTSLLLPLGSPSLSLYSLVSCCSRSRLSHASLLALLASCLMMFDSHHLTTILLQSLWWYLNLWRCNNFR